VTPAVARVLPEVAALERPFDYSAEALDLVVGDRVRVQLHGRSVRGWVVGLADGSDVAGLKSVARSLGKGPPARVVELCEWAAWRFAGAWSKLLATASPQRVVTSLAPAPPVVALPVVHNLQRVVGQRLVRATVPTLLRVGPCTDPIELVLSVLHGVTGESREGAVVVTTPTSAWAERLTERLRRRGITAAGPTDWVLAASGAAVVVGARAAALSPVPRLAAALVLDAHDSAYKQTQAPCWDAVTILAERCRRDQAPLIATSWCATPTLRALAPHEEVLEHEQRLWPKVVVADLGEADPREGGLSGTFVGAARRALAEPGDGVRVAVVLQRLGAARLLACRRCGALAICEPHRLALREGDGGLACDDGCRQLARLCISCGATKLVALREGIATLAKRVSALLGEPVAEVSAASSQIDTGSRIVVGTEAVLSRVRRAPVVCFAELDDYLCAPRAHGALEALRAVGLAGRLTGARGSSAPGLVVVQTRLAAHPAVACAVNGDPSGVITQEADRAAALSLPPHVAQCALSGEAAAEFATALGAAGLVVHDDTDRYLVEADDHTTLCDALAATPRPSGRLRVEVDPAGT